MNDQEIERLLRRLRPSDPQAGLRARILIAAPVRLWPWTVAASALLAATALIPAAGDAALRRLTPSFTPDSDAGAVEDLAAWLGDGEEARRYARAEIRRIRRQLEEEGAR